VRVCRYPISYFSIAQAVEFFSFSELLALLYSNHIINKKYSFHNIEIELVIISSKRTVIVKSFLLHYETLSARQWPIPCLLQTQIQFLAEFGQLKLSTLVNELSVSGSHSQTSAVPLKQAKSDVDAEIVKIEADITEHAGNVKKVRWNCLNWMNAS